MSERVLFVLLDSHSFEWEFEMFQDEMRREVSGRINKWRSSKIEVAFGSLYIHPRFPSSHFKSSSFSLYSLQKISISSSFILLHQNNSSNASLETPSWSSSLKNSPSLSSSIPPTSSNSLLRKIVREYTLMIPMMMMMQWEGKRKKEKMHNVLTVLMRWWSIILGKDRKKESNEEHETWNREEEGEEREMKLACSFFPSLLHLIPLLSILYKILPLLQNRFYNQERESGEWKKE